MACRRTLNEAALIVWADAAPPVAHGARPGRIEVGGDSCEVAIVGRVSSPDGAWDAVLNEATCPVGLGGMDITTGVHLVSTRDPARTVVLLGVDTGGHEDERPRLAWTAPDVLQVTVYDHSYLKVLTRGFGGVRVDLRYDPDDPADRAAWRREHGMPPDPGP